VSWEAWGDGDDGFDSERLTDAGWWTPDDVDEARELMSAIAMEPLYEDGVMAKGVSPRFLMRLTLLRHKFGQAVDESLVAEARTALAAKGGKT